MEKAKVKGTEIKRTECPRTVGQQQKVYPVHNGNTRRRMKGTEEIFKAIITKISPKLMSNTQPQTQEAHKTLNKINTKKLHQSISYSLQTSIV